jgi:hypothetical protein
MLLNPYFGWFFKIFVEAIESVGVVEQNIAREYLV